MHGRHLGPQFTHHKRTSTPPLPCSLERQHLPVHDAALAEAHEAARAAAFAKFDKERFGSSLDALRAALEAAVERERGWGGVGGRV